MKNIKITNEEIVENLKEIATNALLTKKENEILNEIVSGEISVDKKGDILADSPSGRYWITTEPEISLWNGNGVYEIKFFYHIHKGSKYNEILFTVRR